jgi:ribosomal protein S18 acetylase RimI-like enzyme
MPVELRIRQARRTEASGLTDLAMRSKAVWGYDDRFMAMCLEELTVRPDAIDGGEVWVAETDDAIVGLVELVREGRSAEIRMIFVEPGCVRSGIGSALWRHAEARARAQGAADLNVDADPNAEGFYRRMGMRVVGSSPSGSIPGRFLPRMAKSLATSPSHATATRRMTRYG